MLFVEEKTYSKIAAYCIPCVVSSESRTLRLGATKIGNELYQADYHARGRKRLGKTVLYVKTSSQGIRREGLDCCRALVNHA